MYIQLGSCQSREMGQDISITTVHSQIESILGLQIRVVREPFGKEVKNPGDKLVDSRCVRLLIVD